MASSTADIEQDVNTRWEMANYGRPSRGYDNGQITLGPTKQHDRAGYALEEIAAMMVPDGVWTDEAQDDEDGLERLIGETWEEIERRFKAWAARYPERRRRAAEQLRAEQSAMAKVPA